MKVRGFVRLGVLAVLLLGFAGLSYGQINVSIGGGEVGFGVGVSIGVAPPPLPVYDQPPIPEAGYVWTPGYWAWDDDDGYYWVPGTWVQPPEVGVVWTPGYWGWNDGMYQWNDGYWGNEVGYYGGIDYGYGYPGEGYYGGRWQGNRFYYNQAVNTGIGRGLVTTVYDNPVPQNARTPLHVSFNGGQGGTHVRPTPQQEQARQTAKVHITPAQKEQVQAAKANPQTHARNNGGKPAVAATAKPGDFQHAVQAKAAGGHVDQKSLEANAKTAKVEHKGGHEAGKTANAGAANTHENGKAAANAHENGNAAGTRNTHENGNAEANTHEANKPGARENSGANARETGRAVPKPGNAESNTHARETEPSATRPNEKPSRESGNASGMPQSEGSRHAAEPSSHSNASDNASRHESTPSHGAAAKESGSQKSSEKPKSDKPDKNDKQPQ